MGEAHGLIAGKCGQARQVLLAIASPLQWAGVYFLWGRATLPRHIIKLQRLELEIQNRKSVEYSQLRHVNIASRVRMPKPNSQRRTSPSSLGRASMLMSSDWKEHEHQTRCVQH